MTSERENFSTNKELGALTVKRYDIDGNVIRAFYDADGRLVFVIDDTVFANKPNALLVIDPVQDRKWDDILANDYGVALEVVRPKKDNKYQKLDIEYSGLQKYDKLFNDFNAGRDAADALAGIYVFRAGAARHAAAERLTVSEKVAENARETVEKARAALASLQVRLKELRTKLGRQRKDVGKEPTKQSAAKILRTESQIDALKDKQRRAQKRMDTARRRWAAADDAADAARAILARSGAVADEMPSENAAAVPMVARTHAPVAVTGGDALPVATSSTTDTDNANDTVENDEVPQFNTIVFDEYEDDGDDDETDALPVLPEPKPQIIAQEQSEQKAKEMADEEVKPLFDKDPNILDEEIAFKPIGFDVAQPEPVAPSVARDVRYDNMSATSPSPLSFTPPSDMNAGADMNRAAEPVRPAPVLDTITSVDAPVSPAPAPQPAPSYYQSAPADSAMRPAPVSPAVPGAPAAPVRPVSPISGTPAAPVQGGGAKTGGKPTLLYYVLLIALIALSIFTLWLYQSKNSDTVPNLAETTKAEQTEPQEKVQQDKENGPFIQSEEVVVAEVEPSPAPVPEVSEPAQEQVPVVPEIDETVPAVPVVAEPEPAETQMPEDTPFLTEPEPEPEPVQPIINKPVYNAGAQNEDMFVADENYDTEVVASPQQFQETVTETQYATASGATCEDGTAPDINGCCTGEVYTNTGTAYACCSQETGECFQPMQ